MASREFAMSLVLLDHRGEPQIVLGGAPPIVPDRTHPDRLREAERR